MRKDGQSAVDREHLVAGQKPHSIIISCSASRIPPEIIFDQKLGEVFVVRNAGEALDSVSLASIEYAIEHLGSRLILVLGHESCGAVKAAISTMNGTSAGSPHLDKLVADIQPRIKEVLSGRATASTGAIVEAQANAKGITADLPLRSQIIQHKLEKGELEIHHAIYFLDSGKVEFK
ncbi:MAG: carbonic anhydrase [Pseudomonadota bacterium]